MVKFLHLLTLEALGERFKYFITLFGWGLEDELLSPGSSVTRQSP
jgi:hypothetical protein